MSTVFRPTFSYYFLCLLLIACSGALVCVFMVFLPIWIKLPLVLLIMGHFVNMVRRQRAITAFWHDTNRRWQLLTRASDVLTVELRADSLVTRHLMVLNFVTIRSYGHPRQCTVLLLTGSLPAECLRFLRAMFRIC